MAQKDSCWKRRGYGQLRDRGKEKREERKKVGKRGKVGKGALFLGCCATRQRRAMAQAAMLAAGEREMTGGRKRGRRGKRRGRGKREGKKRRRAAGNGDSGLLRCMGEEGRRGRGKREKEKGRERGAKRLLVMGIRGYCVARERREGGEGKGGEEGKGRERGAEGLLAMGIRRCCVARERREGGEGKGGEEGKGRSGLLRAARERRVVRVSVSAGFSRVLTACNGRPGLSPHSRSRMDGGMEQLHAS